MNIILEGTDGVGKTATINELKKYNVICKDRCKEVISKYMNFDISVEFRANIYYKYLINNDNMVIFMINNDKNELMKRICSRECVDEYDLNAYEYNLLYLETYNYMKNNNMLANKLFLADVTDLDLNSQVEKVKKIIDRR